MVCKGFMLVIVLLATSQICNAVRVNMKGSLSFGKDVINLVKHYVNQGHFNRRRFSSHDSKEESLFYSTVNSARLCRNLDLCQNEFREFIVQYVTALVTVAYTAFDRLFNVNNEEVKSIVDVPMRITFEKEFKHSLKKIRNVLKTANEKFLYENEVYIWTDVVKKICGNIQETAIIFVSERFIDNSEDKHEIKKKLVQQLVMETILVEKEFLARLCSEQKICFKSYECTKALNTLMTSFKTMHNDRVKAFVRVFYEVLAETTFYSKLSVVTVKEFQIVLNDMAFSDNAPTKDVLLAIQNTVESSLNSSSSNYHIVKGRDVELVHVILSDMNHIYSKSKAEPFYKHLRGFYEWSKGGGRLDSIVRQIMNDISNQITLLSDDLIVKLINAVRVFLEITIDPED